MSSNDWQRKSVFNIAFITSVQMYWQSNTAKYRCWYSAGNNDGLLNIIVIDTDVNKLGVVTMLINSLPWGEVKVLW